MASTTMSVSGTIELYGIGAGGKTKYSNDIEISNSIIENGTINYIKVTVTYRETKRVAWARATGFIGGYDTSGSRKQFVSMGEIPRKNEDVKSGTFPSDTSFKPAKKDGVYKIWFSVKNNMATLNDVDVDFYNISIFIDYTPPHSHSYTTETSRTPSTCYTKGSVTKKCSCGATQTIELALDPNNHDGGTEVRNAVSATCTDNGYTGDTYCKGCGAKLSSGSTIAKLAHTEVTIPAVAPTCTATGLTAGKKCSVCGTIITAQQTIPAKGHSYTSQVIAPTATVDGYTLHTCSGCGNSYKDNYTINKIFIGTSQPSKIFFGTQEVKEIYYGTTKVYG